MKNSERTVLVFTRLDDADDTTVRAGAAWAKLLGADLAVCHVMPPLFGALAGVESGGRVVRDYLERHLGDDASSVRVLVADGDPEQAMLQVARRVKPALVVVGPSDEWLLWPRSWVAEQLLEKLDTSVLVARNSGQGPVAVGAALVDQDHHLVDLASQVAQAQSRAFRVIHATDDVKVFERICRLLPGGGTRNDNADRVECFVRARELERMPSARQGEIAVVASSASAALLEASRSAGLLVVGATRGEHRLGRTARTVARRAASSVLVARGDLRLDCSKAVRPRLCA